MDKKTKSIIALTFWIFAVIFLVAMIIVAAASIWFSIGVFKLGIETLGTASVETEGYSTFLLFTLFSALVLMLVFFFSSMAVVNNLGKVISGVNRNILSLKRKD